MNHERYHKIRRIFRILFGISFILFLFYIERVGREYVNNMERMRPVRFVGTVQESEQSEAYELTEDNIPDAEKVSQIILKGHFDQDIPKDTKIYVYMYRTQVVIRQNGKQVFEYGFPDSFPSIAKSMGIEWAYLKSEGIRKSDDIEITIKLVYKGNYKAVYENFLDNMCAGERYTLMSEQVKKNIFKISISLIILMLGIFFTAGMQSLRIMKLPVPDGSITCGMLMITGAICTFIDYRYITLMFENGFFVNILDNITQLLICEFLVSYLKTYLISRNFRILTETFLFLWSGLSIGYIVLQSKGIADGPDLILYYMPAAVVMIGCVGVFLLIDYRKYCDKKLKKLLQSCFIMAVTAVIEIVHYCLQNYYWITVLQTGLFLFTVGQMNVILNYTKENLVQAKRAEELEKELIQSQITIMMSQIQPHFLYNTLTSIQELCLTAPQKAHQAITWFAQFLRGNMDSLSTTELIPFDKELHHVENYLKLETIRFGNLLNITYEISVSDFKIPALCVQPIVENAVRYGVSKKESGGTVLIGTYETAEGIYIVIKDDGVGMKQDKMGNVVYQDKTKRTHLGIENVRKRIMTQCNGTVIITSMEGIGTIVSIQIPRERLE